ncbi:hypothetical protein EC968_005983 [Mortierella alpina]|nr:hypothetical protein EC968_005983 [Mortierella alpina]
MNSSSSESSSASLPSFRLEVHIDPDWLTNLRACPVATDSALVARAEAAFSASGPLVSHEDTHGALKVLLSHGLVVTTMSEPLSTPPLLAHQIVHILNTASSGGSMTATITRGSASTTFVVPRRIFMLRELAAALHVDIYIFSARAKAKLFKSTTPAAGTVVIFHAVDSYLGTSEYLLLAPTTHPIPPCAPSPTPSPPSQAAAQLRTAPRQHCRTRKPADLDAAKCEEFVLVGLMRTMKAQVKKEIHKVVTKGPEETKAQRLRSAYTRTLDRLKTHSRLPRGSMKIAAEEAKKIYGPGYNISEMDLSNRLEANKAMRLWREMIESKFDQVWQRAQDKQSRDGSNLPESDSSESSDDEAAETDDKDAGKRTCTANLQEILRIEAANHFETILGALEAAQLETSILIEETAFLALKTVHLESEDFCRWPPLIMQVASGAIYYEHGASGTPQFEIIRLLPSGFKIRDPTIPSSVAVAPIPDFLEGVLTQRRGDIVDILSQNYLQFVQARLLQRKPSARTQKGDQVHPTWTLLINQMETNYAMQERTIGTTTVNTATRQLAVSIRQHWEGPIYSRILIKLLRILLRLHLAPQREKTFQERRNAFATEKNQEAALENSDRLSRSSRKWKLGELLDELTVATNKQNCQREQALLDLIFNLQSDIGKKTEEPAEQDEYQRLFRLNQDADLDDLDDDSDTEDEDDGLTPTAEPSRKHLRRLEIVLRNFVECPKQTWPISRADVEKKTYSGTRFTEAQCDTVSSLANILAPYIPKRRIGENGRLGPSGQHVTLRAPLIIIANAVLHAAGYHQFAASVSPVVSPASCQALALSGPALFEVLCSRDHGMFDAQDEDGNPITNARHVSTLSGKRAIFGSFFDLQKVDSLCSKHGLTFANRITFQDRFTIRIMGNVIPHGPDRTGYLTISNYQERKKKGSKTVSMGIDWSQKCLELGLGESELNAQCQELAKQVKDLENSVKVLRRQHAAKEVAQTEMSHRRSQLECFTHQESEAYARLQQARSETRDIRSTLMPREAMLRSMRQDLYALNKIHDASKSGMRPKTKDQPTKTFITWDQSQQEDYTELLDISYLVSSQDKLRQIVFSGTDYGICKMSETVALTWQEMESYLNRYHALFGWDAITDELSSESDLIMPTDSGEESATSSLSPGYNVDHEQLWWISDSIMNMDQGGPQFTSMDTTNMGDMDHEQEAAWTDTDDEYSDTETDESWSRRHERSAERASLLRMLKIPRSHKITAEQLNDISHSMRTGRKRERRLKRANAVKEALDHLSERENVMKKAFSTAALDAARARQREVGPVLKAFEGSKARVRDLRNQRLRTQRAYAKLCASERTYVRDHARRQSIQGAEEGLDIISRLLCRCILQTAFSKTVHG